MGDAADGDPALCLAPPSGATAGEAGSCTRSRRAPAARDEITAFTPHGCNTYTSLYPGCMLNIKGNMSHFGLPPALVVTGPTAGRFHTCRAFTLEDGVWGMPFLLVAAAVTTVASSEDACCP